MYEYHPISNWYPRQSGDDLQNLMDNIAHFGQQQPIILFDGMIADGRHRYEICLQLDIEPFFETFTGTFEELDAKIQALNAHTKPITKGQRIAIGLEREAYYAQLAKENLKRSGQDYGKGSKGSADRQNPIKPITAMDKASQAVNVPKRTLHKAKSTREQSPELYEAIINDEIAPSTAYDVARDPVKRETFETLVNDPVSPLPAREAVRVARGQSTGDKLNQLQRQQIKQAMRASDYEFQMSKPTSDVLKVITSMQLDAEEIVKSLKSGRIQAEQVPFVIRKLQSVIDYLNENIKDV